MTSVARVVATVARVPVAMATVVTVVLVPTARVLVATVATAVPVPTARVVPAVTTVATTINPSDNTSLMILSVEAHNRSRHSFLSVSSVLL